MDANRLMFRCVSYFFVMELLQFEVGLLLLLFFFVEIVLCSGVFSYFFVMELLQFEVGLLLLLFFFVAPSFFPPKRRPVWRRRRHL